MLAGTVVAPGHAMAWPMMPEFIVPQDGAEKQDCERNAAKRWLATHAKRLLDLRPIYLGDDLFACQPMAEAITAAGSGVRHGSMRRPAAVEVTATGGQSHGSDPQRQARGGAGVRPDR